MVTGALIGAPLAGRAERPRVASGRLSTALRASARDQPLPAYGRARRLPAIGPAGGVRRLPGSGPPLRPFPGPRPLLEENEAVSRSGPRGG